MHTVRVPEDAGVIYPPKAPIAIGASHVQFYTDPSAGMRSLQDFKKISILEVRGLLLRLALLPGRRRRHRHRLRGLAVRPRRLALRRLRGAAVAMVHR